MFEISEQLILEHSDEIFGVSQIWKRLSLVNDEEVMSLSHAKVCMLKFCFMSWKDESEPNIKYCLGTTVGLKIHHNTELLETIDGEPMEFE